ncbi:hypothetical protein COOONC_08831 [Cooperia oncophora]
MIAMGFVMEGLQFDPQHWQNVLVIGLGGGTVCNFFGAAKSLRVNLTTVELDPLMVTIANEWFGLHETPVNTVIVEDGVKFLHEAAERGEKYKSLILDACNHGKQSIICPAEEFMKPRVIQDMAKVLDKHGVVTVNILCSRDSIANEEHLLSKYREHFTSCFLLRYNNLQRLLVCTQREGWSFTLQKERFMQKFREIDHRFKFGLSDLISKQN